MTLSFSTKFPWGEPTNFVAKIWNSLNQHYGESIAEEFYEYGADLYDIDQHLPKHHTLREDRKNRWKPGCKIHPVIHNRTSDRFQFAPTIKCISVQDIRIKPESRQVIVFQKWHEDRNLYDAEIKRLAINDGFDSVEDFWRWFDKDCELKIIHWTDLKY